MYCVRKLKNWKIISWDYSIWIWILLIVLAIMFLILMYNKFDVDNLDFTIIPGLLPFLLMLWAWIFLTIVSLKILRAKNLKNNWKWILKKIKVTWMAALYKKNFSWCYLIFKDGDMLYYSDGIDWWVCNRNKCMEYNWIFIRIWDTFDVYIDPENSKNYWVDIDFLMEK
jgi:hypothetical protein